MISSQVDSDWAAVLTEAGLNDPSQLASSAPERSLAGQWQRLTKPGLGHRTRWRWSLSDGADSRTVYVKHYARPPWRMQWDRIWRQQPRRSSGWWEYRQSLELREAQLGAPAPVGFAENMAGVFERASTVVLGAAPGDAFDRVWMRALERDERLVSPASRRDLARRLARFVAAFHQSGRFHRDLYLCHIFIDADPDGRRPPTLSLIDLARVHRPRWRRHRWLIKDLAQLDSSARQIGATRSDRLRFLTTYLAIEPRVPRARAHIRAIMRKSDWILRRIARKSRSR